ncbi:S-layer homology domain-containing protein [Paenibacillus sacheonensis]|uniref:S-layer homology domain-containing protein n=1 Tax=Paenibacillus sacheonensis TaxID=742054 RepID=A0A7X4YSY7_9BACL|nr:S-layer homology domain-containing protein [Paenibacillus sacheonensis]MBM7567037.1 hypothetical protein [Paenibacillus sacheonensis]NBC71031.1 S-layer homology domain-containing protein [Paenibacillus sacheonensis]
MKNTIKLVTLSAAALITLSFAGQSFAAATHHFTDLEGVASKDKIIALQESGDVRGISDERYFPNATITAAQGIQLIVNALDLNIDTIRFFKEPKATDYYSKADDNAWYAKTLIIAANNGLDLPKDLNPDQTWTREAFTRQLMHAIETHVGLPVVKIRPDRIADTDKFANGVDSVILSAVVLNIAKLDDKNNFLPTQPITRAEAGEEIYDALAYLNARQTAGDAPSDVHSHPMIPVTGTSSEVHSHPMIPATDATSTSNNG